jgi:hypothetical protein
MRHIDLIGRASPWEPQRAPSAEADVRPTTRWERLLTYFESKPELSRLEAFRLIEKVEVIRRDRRNGRGSDLGGGGTNDRVNWRRRSA